MSRDEAARGMTRDELLALPAAVNIPTAARALAIGESLAYALARSGDFPVRINRLGRAWRVPTAELLRYLGIEESSAA